VTETIKFPGVYYHRKGVVELLVLLVWFLVKVRSSLAALRCYLRSDLLRESEAVLVHYIPPVFSRVDKTFVWRCYQWGVPRIQFEG